MWDEFIDADEACYFGTANKGRVIRYLRPLGSTGRLYKCTGMCAVTRVVWQSTLALHPSELSLPWPGKRRSFIFVACCMISLAENELGFSDYPWGIDIYRPISFWSVWMLLFRCYWFCLGINKEGIRKAHIVPRGGQVCGFSNHGESEVEHEKIHTNISN